MEYILNKVRIGFAKLFRPRATTQTRKTTLLSRLEFDYDFHKELDTIYTTAMFYKFPTMGLKSTPLNHNNSFSNFYETKGLLELGNMIY